MYETVVVSTVVMHFAFIAYVLAGGFLALRWRRTMWLHVPAVIWGIGIAAKRVDCPLTWVERWARTKAAMTPLSPDGFVAHYITGVIYPAGWVAAAQLVMFAIVAASWTLYLWLPQFFRTLPTDLEEAAILDGCSPWQIYWRILLPHSRPAVLVLGVLTWVNVWNDFLWPLLMIQRNSLATLTLGLVRLRGEYVARWPVLMAASMLMLVPLVILYAVAQRSFVRGIAVTGLGG